MVEYCLHTFTIDPDDAKDLLSAHVALSSHILDEVIEGACSKIDGEMKAALIIVPAHLRLNIYARNYIVSM